MLRNLKSLVFFTMMLLSVTIFGATLEKGIYTIQNETYHDNPVGAGMSRSYTEAQSTVEVTESGTYVHLGFNNTEFMGDFIIKVNGNKVVYEVAKHDGATQIKELKFQVGSLSDTITVGLHVIPMDTIVEYQVTFNESTLNLVKKVEVEVIPPVKEEIKTELKDTQQSQTTQPIKETQVAEQETVQATKSESTPEIKTETAQKEIVTEEIVTEEIKTTKAEKTTVEETTEVTEEIEETEVTEKIEEVVSIIEEQETEEATDGKEAVVEETVEETEVTSTSWMLYVGIAVVVVLVVGLIVFKIIRK